MTSRPVLSIGTNRHIIQEKEIEQCLCKGRSYYFMKTSNLDNLTLVKLFETINRKYSDRTALQVEAKSGKFEKYSFKTLGKRSVDVFSTLASLGIEKGDRVAILSESRPEWAIAFFGIIACAAIVVPLDVKLSEKEIQYILNNSQAKCLFVSGNYFNKIKELRTVLPYIKNVILMDDIKHKDEILFKDLKKQKEEEKKRPTHSDDTVVLVYTSGTTGVAKGVELTYENLFHQVRAFSEIIHYSDKDRLLSILPLNHMLEITGGLIAPLYAGASITYCSSYKPSNMLKLIKDRRITGMVSVPLVLKMIHDGIMAKTGKLTKARKIYFNNALKLSRMIPGRNTKLKKILFRAVHEAFGVDFKGFVCGGAPLDIEVEKDFVAMGFKILQGYGLTETAPVTAVNTFTHHKFGSVGKPLPGVEVKIDKNEKDALSGEILTRGPHVMKGYYQNPEATGETIKDGWLHTGDIGYFDKDGFLYISGRIKNMIVLGAGKKVFPEELEQVIGKSDYIKEICVVGRVVESGPRKGNEEVHAVIVPDIDMFASKNMVSDEAIKDKISREIKRLERELASYKRIKHFIISKIDLPKTVTFKIQRQKVEEIFD